jgi:hypothetical protein
MLFLLVFRHRRASHAQNIPAAANLTFTTIDLPGAFHSAGNQFRSAGMWSGC